MDTYVIVIMVIFAVVVLTAACVLGWLWYGLVKRLNHAARLKEQELAAAEEAARVQRVFLNKMSHEILAPMGTIFRMAEMALREDTPESTRQNNIAVKHAAGALLSLFSDMLDFSKAKPVTTFLKPDEYYFSALIDDVISVIKMRALYSRLRFLVNIDCNIPQVLYGDAGHIRQVLVYLLNNAILFTDRGFGYFSLSVTAERTEGSTVYLTIEVSDNGRGIEAEQLEHLFDETRFNHISRLQEHSDLRLPTIKKIITSMGGDIRVASKVGQGTTFTVVLPQKIESPGKLCEVENADEISILIYERRDQCTQSIKCTLNNLGIAHTTVTSAADFYQALKSRKFSFVFAATFLYERAMREYPQLETDAKIVLVEEFGDDIPDHGYSVLSTPIYTINVTNIINTAIDTNGDDNTRKTVRRFSAPKARVLVVDDIYNSLQITTGCLLPYHMQIDLSLSGADALNNIKDTHYDLIFIDHMMPDMNGPETLARIRAMGNRTARHKKTPVIALTANAASHIRDLLMTSGFNDYLSKPIDTIKLNMVLEKWLSKDLIVTK